MDEIEDWGFDGYDVADAILPSSLGSEALVLSSPNDFNWDNQEDFLLESFFNLETDEILWQTSNDIQISEEAPVEFVDPSQLQIFDPPFSKETQNNGPRQDNEWFDVMCPRINEANQVVLSQESVSESELTDSAYPSPLTNLPTPNATSDPSLHYGITRKADSIDAELWEEKFSLIYSMHTTTTLTRMRKIFTEDHQFLARLVFIPSEVLATITDKSTALSEKQWKKRIGQWQLEGRLPTKNIKKADMDWMLQIEHKYVHLNKRVKFTYRGFSVESDKLERHKKRFGFQPSEIDTSKGITQPQVSCEN
jgi:hypothetical protein